MYLSVCVSVSLLTILAMRQATLTHIVSYIYNINTYTYSYIYIINILPIVSHCIQQYLCYYYCSYSHYFPTFFSLYTFPFVSNRTMFLLSLLHFFHPSLIPSLSLSLTHSSSLPPYRLHCTALSYRDLLTKKSANFRSPIYRSHVTKKAPSPTLSDQRRICKVGIAGLPYLEKLETSTITESYSHQTTDPFVS